MFVAIAALLLHAACTIGATPLAAPAGSGCHESAPSPNPEQKCCDGDHSPEALLSATVALAPPPAANMELAYSTSITNVFERHMAEIVSPSPGPPLLLSLRI